MADVEKSLVLDVIDGDSGEILVSKEFSITVTTGTTEPPGYGEGFYNQGEYGL